MLGKLFKHEWIAISKLLVVIHGFILIFAILSRLFFEVSGGIEVVMAAGSNNITGIIAAMIIFVLVLFIFCAAMFTSVYIAYRFYKNVFTDQGYLTNTLPVTPAQIIISKGLTALLWTIIDLVVLGASLLILFANGEFMSVLLPAFCWILLIMILLSPFLMIIHMYFCVAVGSLVPNHKILGAIGVYIISYVIIQILSTIVLAATGLGFSVGSMDASTANMTGAQASQYMISLLTPMFLVSVICEIIAIVAFFLVTKYIMTKKLNLE